MAGATGGPTRRRLASMTDHAVSEIESYDRPRTWVDLEDAAEVQRELSPVHGSNQQELHERTTCANAPHLSVDHAREPRTDLRENADAFFPQSHCRTEERLRSSAVMGNPQLAPGQHRITGDGDVLVRIEVDLALDTCPVSEIVRGPSAEADVGCVEISESERRDLEADLNASCRRLCNGRRGHAQTGEDRDKTKARRRTHGKQTCVSASDDAP